MAAQWEVPGLGILMARAYDVREGTLDPAAVARRIDEMRPYIDVLASMASLRPQETIADAGCGAASVSLALALRAPKARIGGVDVSPKAIEAAKAAAASLRIPAAFRTSTVEDLPTFAPGASLVLASFIFNLVPAKAAFLVALGRTMGPAGRLLLVDAFVDPSLPDAEAQPGATGPIMPSTLATLAAEAGLRATHERDVTALVQDLHRDGRWPWPEVVRVGLKVIAWRFDRAK